MLKFVYALEFDMVQFQENNLKVNSTRTIFTKGYKKHKFNWFSKDTDIYKENFIRMQTFKYLYMLNYNFGPIIFIHSQNLFHILKS